MEATLEMLRGMASRGEVVHTTQPAGECAVRLEEAMRLIAQHRADPHSGTGANEKYMMQRFSTE